NSTSTGGSSNMWLNGSSNSGSVGNSSNLYLGGSGNYGTDGAGSHAYLDYSVSAIDHGSLAAGSYIVSGSHVSYLPASFFW
ncbi:MAG TPA: hypothetical protein VK281_10425, partial [Xanthobacteraceae bacterium]|nr:hypothetical protein [Xanthobacteraceae bacterium]